MNKNILAGCLFLMASVLTLFSGGCAQIGAYRRTKDTTAPLMVKANPANEQLNFTETKSLSVLMNT
jgi:hypothetical protein